MYPVKIRKVNSYTPVAGFTNAATANDQTVVTDGRYRDESTYNFSAGNIIEGTPRDGVPIAYIWSAPDKSPIAKITNALNNQTAYTSFENGEQEGNWIISDNSRNTTSKITGRKSYDLNGTRSVTASTPSGKQYFVSYWAMNGAATVSANGASIAATAGVSKNGWTYYEHLLPNSTTTVTVTGSNSTIDELRLYPSDAEMETWSYLPMVGIINSCDKNNHTNSYEYDGLGRLTVIRDQDANIVKTYKYNYKQ